MIILACTCACPTINKFATWSRPGMMCCVHESPLPAYTNTKTVGKQTVAKVWEFFVSSMPPRTQQLPSPLRIEQQQGPCVQTHGRTRLSRGLLRCAQISAHCHFGAVLLHILHEREHRVVEIRENRIVIHPQDGSSRLRVCFEHLAEYLYLWPACIAVGGGCMVAAHRLEAVAMPVRIGLIDGPCVLWIVALSRREMCHDCESRRLGNRLLSEQQHAADSEQSGCCCRSHDSGMPWHENSGGSPQMFAFGRIVALTRPRTWDPTNLKSAKVLVLSLARGAKQSAKST